MVSPAGGTGAQRDSPMALCTHLVGQVLVSPLALCPQCGPVGDTCPHGSGNA